MKARLLAAALSGAAALTLLAACGSSSSGPSQAATPTPTSAPRIAGVVTVNNLPHGHFTGVHLHYSYKPPLGGYHSEYPLDCAIYTAPVPDENAVHSLEHGAVWLTYQPGVEPAGLAKLADLNPSYVLVSPYPGQPAKVMATAWGLQLRADSTTDPRLEEFVKAYAGGGQGGEPGGACSGATPEQAEQLLQQGPPSGQPDPPDPADKPS